MLHAARADWSSCPCLLLLLLLLLLGAAVAG
jgi:hypothetical protein